MPETTLSLPLSGEEVIEAVVDEIRKRLRADCYLSSTTAYESFAAEIKIRARMRDIGRLPEVEVVVPVNIGKTIDLDSDEDAALTASEVRSEFIIDEQPPNEVRVESGQDVPVLAESADGKKEIKGVRYAKKAEVRR